MKNIRFRDKSALTLCWLTVCLPQVGLAHSVAGPIDVDGKNPSATHLASISCFDDGNGPADYLTVQIKDLSAPVNGLLISVQISKDDKMTNTTDPISADNAFGPLTSLRAGNGSYSVSINKTAAGIRNFALDYHCLTREGLHTGTDIGKIFQLQ